MDDRRGERIVILGVCLVWQLAAVDDGLRGWEGNLKVKMESAKLQCKMQKYLEEGCRSKLRSVLSRIKAINCGSRRLDGRIRIAGTKSSCEVWGHNYNGG